MIYLKKLYLLFLILFLELKIISKSEDIIFLNKND